MCFRVSDLACADAGLSLTSACAELVGFLHLAQRTAPTRRRCLQSVSGLIEAALLGIPYSCQEFDTSYSRYQSRARCSSITRLIATSGARFERFLGSCTRTKEEDHPARDREQAQQLHFSLCMQGSTCKIPLFAVGRIRCR